MGVVMTFAGKLCNWLMNISWKSKKTQQQGTQSKPTNQLTKPKPHARQTILFLCQTLPSRRKLEERQVGDWKG